MAVFLSPHQLAFIFGLLGMPTFYMIYKKKSSEGYQSIPYVAALCSSILFLYYGFLKSVFLIISINSIGCAIESAYLIFYLIYAPPKEKVNYLFYMSNFSVPVHHSAWRFSPLKSSYKYTLYLSISIKQYIQRNTRFIKYSSSPVFRVLTNKLLHLAEIHSEVDTLAQRGSHWLGDVHHQLSNKGPKRMTAVGWICVAYNIATFAAPLSIVRRVIKTKSVEFMPFSLSLSLTLCATSWFFYGLFVKDYFIATPNVLGFVFGIAQMILYFIYKNKKGNETKTKQHEEFEGQCKEVSLSSVDRKDNINQPADIKEMMKVIIVDDQKPTE
ncbi:hypothetical protein EZV62_028209 [Acer yangbiense]|uniref:Bidirectional sugar transporter SWEET n=1 Tax=Acer yangbiense TaxID=1000413 RepID=A0A5C7GP84_9ROSI|nr:hypothetical protein EZV62_028209 [Acer yangbiense]